MSKQSRYTPEFRERAVRMLLDQQSEYESRLSSDTQFHALRRHPDLRTAPCPKTTVRGKHAVIPNQVRAGRGTSAARRARKSSG